MRTLTLFFVLAAVESLADAQWFWQNPLPQGNNLFGVSFTDANTLTALPAAL